MEKVCERLLEYNIHKERKEETLFCATVTLQMILEGTIETFISAKFPPQILYRRNNLVNYKVYRLSYILIIVC